MTLISSTHRIGVFHAVLYLNAICLGQNCECCHIDSYGKNNSYNCNQLNFSTHLTRSLHLVYLYSIHTKSVTLKNYSESYKIYHCTFLTHPVLPFTSITSITTICDN